MSFLENLFSCISSTFLFILGAAVLAYIMFPIVNFLYLSFIKLTNSNESRLAWNLSCILIGFLIIGLCIFSFNIIKSKITSFLESMDFDIVRIKEYFVQKLDSILSRFYVKREVSSDLINKGIMHFKKFKTLKNHGPESLHALLMAFLLIVSSIHIVRDWFKWESRISLLFSITNIKKIYIQKFCANFTNSMRSWIVGQIVVSIMLSIYYAVSFYLIKVPFAILIGIIFGFACFIPYLGDVFAFGGMFWILSSISATLFMIVGVILISIAGHIFGSHILTPWIIGSHTGLHPIQIILGFLVYSKLFGVWGVILNIPISILINSVFKAIFYKEDDTNV